MNPRRDVSLFRSQAIAAQRDARFGDPVFYVPPSLLGVTLVLAALCLAALLLAWRVPLKQTVQVRGIVDPARGVMKVMSPASGILAHWWVAEGETVQAGQRLATVRRNAFDAEGISRLEEERDAVSRQLGWQQQAAALTEAEAVLRERGLIAQEALVQQELASLAAQQQTLEAREQLGQQALARMESLVQAGHAAATQRDQAMDTLLALRQSLSGLHAQRSARRAALDELAQARRLASLQRAQQALENNRQTSRLRSQLQSVQADHVFSVVASAAGIVGYRSAQEGTAVDTRMPLLTILPSNLPLEAVLYVPSRALGKLRAGQPLLLALDAYPVREYGYLSARIASLSANALDPRETLLPVEVQESVFVIRGVMAQEGAGATNGLRLQAGMLFTAHVVISEQPLLARWLAPLLSLGTRT